MQQLNQAPQLNLEKLVDMAKVFRASSVFSDTFFSVLTDFPPELLTGVDGQSFDNVLREIEGRPDVNQLQATLNFELSGGEGALLNLAFIMLNNHIPNVPKLNNKPDTYTKSYNDIKAICDACSTEVATGLFDRRRPIESIIFEPEQVLYARNLEGIFPDGSLKCDNCGNRGFEYERTGQTLVFRDKILKGKEPEFKIRVENIIKEVTERIVKINPKRTYKQVESDVIDGFYRIYKTVRRNREPNGEVQYPKSYKLFEWIRRENGQLEQLPWIDHLTRNLLQEAIYKHIILPYAVIKMRVKSLESIFRKSLRVAYDLKISEDEKQLSLRDLLGLRVVLPTKEDCHKLHSLISRDQNFRVIDYKDFFEGPKSDRPYGGIHMHVEHSGIVYSVQLRTHHSDMEAEIKDPKLVHEVAYVPKIVDLIKDNVPYQVRRVFASILGVEKSPLLITS